MEEYRKYILALRKCAIEHDNDETSFAHIVVSDLCRDTANLLETLEQEPFINKVCVSSKACEHDKEVVLGKIRTEILEYIDDLDIAKEICDIFDKYKVESEAEDGNDI